MALGRSLTKKLQKLNKSVRKSDSEDEPLPPIKESLGSDEFISISFEETCENPAPNLHDSDASSITSINPPIQHPFYSRTPSSSTTSNSILTLSEDTPLSSGLNTPGINASPPSFSTKPLINTGSFSRDLLPLLNQSHNTSVDTSPELNGIPTHQSNPSTSSSRYSPILSQTQMGNLNDAFFVSEVDDTEVSSAMSNNIGSALDKDDKARIMTNEDEQDAQADEMAMYILEKVNADEYVREIKTGSWYI